MWVQQQSSVQWKRYILDWAQAGPSGTSKLHEQEARLLHYPHCYTNASPVAHTYAYYWNSLQPVVGSGKILGLAYRSVTLMCWCELKTKITVHYGFTQAWAWNTVVIGSSVGRSSGDTSGHPFCWEKKRIYIDYCLLVKGLAGLSKVCNKKNCDILDYGVWRRGVWMEL